MTIPKMTLRVPKALLAAHRRDVVMILRLGAGVNAMESMVRLMLRIRADERSAIAMMSRIQAFTAALAYFREIVKTIETERYSDRLFELIEKGLPFSAVPDLPLADVRPLLSSTHPEVGGNVLLKIRNKVAFHWDAGPFEALVDGPDGPIVLFTIDGAPDLDRIFAASAYAMAGFALRAPLERESADNSLSAALDQAVRQVGHALEAACLGLIVEAGGVPPTKYLITTGFIIVTTRVAWTEEERKANRTKEPGCRRPTHAMTRYCERPTMKSLLSIWTFSLLVWCLTFTGPAIAQKPAAPLGVSVFIGPQIRDGFVDMDAGIRDSIRDIQQECQQAGFSIAPTAVSAELVLIVIGRGTPVKGDVGFASAVGGIGSGFVVPNNVPTITTSLRVGKYERTASREGGTWRNAAKNVAEDLTAWVEANRGALKR